MTRSLPEHDLIRLNAYLDGELSRRGRAAVEARFAESAALREEMQALREVKALLGMAERVSVPRNFTLDPAIYSKPARAGLFGGRLELSSLSTLATAGAVALAAVICGGVVLTQFGLGGLNRQMPEAALVLPAEVAADSALGAVPQEAIVIETQASEAYDGDLPAGSMPIDATTAVTPMAESTTLPEAGVPPPMPAAGLGEGVGGGPPSDTVDAQPEPGLAMPLPSPTVAAVVEGATEHIDRGDRGPAEKAGATMQPSEPLAAEGGETATLPPRYAWPSGIGAQTLWIAGGIAALLVAVGLALVVLRLRRS